MLWQGLEDVSVFLAYRWPSAAEVPIVLPGISDRGSKKGTPGVFLHTDLTLNINWRTFFFPKWPLVGNISV